MWSLGFRNPEQRVDSDSGDVLHDCRSSGSEHLASESVVGVAGRSDQIRKAACVASFAVMFFAAVCIMRMQVALLSVSSASVSRSMQYPGCDGANPTGSHVPTPFSGLWWIDGEFTLLNDQLYAPHAHSYTWSFGRSSWRSVEEGYVCKQAVVGTAGSPAAPCAGGMSFSPAWGKVLGWHDTWYARLIYTLSSLLSLVYHIECRADFALCLITVHMFSGLVPVPTLATHCMTRVDDDHWCRTDSYLNGVQYTYQLKRIITCNGTRATHWQAYVSHGTAPIQHATNCTEHCCDPRSSVSNVRPRQLLAQ